MLLAIDMGNTQTAMGLFDGDELVQSWRMPTDRSYTPLIFSCTLARRVT